LQLCLQEMGIVVQHTSNRNHGDHPGPVKMHPPAMYASNKLNNKNPQLARLVKQSEKKGGGDNSFIDGWHTYRVRRYIIISFVVLLSGKCPPGDGARAPPLGGEGERKPFPDPGPGGFKPARGPAGRPALANGLV
jgi:hypothetical protein